MKKGINMLINKLDCNAPINSQKDAIEQLLKIDDEYVTLLVQPQEKKYWENSARVLKSIGFPRNKLAIPGLLQWLQDLNWPGAMIAMETLQNVEVHVMLPYLETAVQIAVEENDDMWIMALKELATSRMSIKASDFKNQELYKILEQSK
ncbi:MULTISPECIES: DUF5071 domain-containing protein [unclassified Clostridium]|uniref:DUF5071 domain-containing protein n=1 Tax=unclassified Clostridium TaxID=2614128 RepID=UPI000297D6EB|nr:MULTISPECIES: DUF5071 domain-containing protein [unclassified Clostridium]EKQ50588.1 MAG: hypothetical protein A370_05593 [Clostridium sp. Maddingley MBC34-26]